MSDNNSLIIKNGLCYINGKLEDTDITISGGKIKSIGKADLNNHKVYDAKDKTYKEFSSVTDSVKRTSRIGGGRPPNPNAVARTATTIPASAVRFFVSAR